MRPRILFVCAGNAGASRMSAAFLDHLAGDRYEAISAGPEPAERPHPEVVEAMAEAGITIPDEPGTLLTPDLADSAALIVEMGRPLGEVPEPAAPHADWGIPDLKGRRLDEVRIFRDTIRRLVERLIARLDTEAVVR